MNPDAGHLGCSVFWGVGEQGVLSLPEREREERKTLTVGPFSSLLVDHQHFPLDVKLGVLCDRSDKVVGAVPVEDDESEGWARRPSETPPLRPISLKGRKGRKIDKPSVDEHGAFDAFLLPRIILVVVEDDVGSRVDDGRDGGVVPLEHLEVERVGGHLVWGESGGEGQTTMAASAQKTFDLLNNIRPLDPKDEIFLYDAEEQKAINKAAPWKQKWVCGGCSSSGRSGTDPPFHLKS